MKDKVLLPFDNNPLTIMYHYSAFAMGIIQANAKTDITPWFCRRYTNCSFDETYAHKFSVSLTDHWSVYDGILLMQSISFHPDTYKKMGLDLLQLMKQMLSDQSYIYGHYNEQYIPGKDSYGIKYRSHDFLLIGYDDAAQVFHSVGYMKDRKFHCYDISYENMLKALLTLQESTISLEFYSFNPNADFSANHEATLSRVDNYLDSNNGTDIHIGKHTYGVTAIADLAEYYRNKTKNPSAFDHRYTRGLMEHKKFMLMRLQYYADIGYLKNEKYLAEAKAVLSMANTVHLLGLKFVASKERNLLNRLCDIMVSLNEREKAYLPEALKEIRKNLPPQ